MFALNLEDICLAAVFVDVVLLLLFICCSVDIVVVFVVVVQLIGRECVLDCIL